jgi:hypothetical protein
VSEMSVYPFIADHRVETRLNPAFLSGRITISEKRKNGTVAHRAFS